MLITVKPRNGNISDIAKARTTSGPLNVLLSSYGLLRQMTWLNTNAKIAFVMSPATTCCHCWERNRLAERRRKVFGQPRDCVWTYSKRIVQEQKKAKRRRDALDDYQRCVFQLDKRKMEYSMNTSKEKDNPEDENLLFIKSLLTHINCNLQNKVLRLRMRLEDLVEEFKLSSANTSSESISAYHQCLPSSVQW